MAEGITLREGECVRLSVGKRHRLTWRPTPTLRFRLLAKDGTAFARIPYKTVAAGDPVGDRHISSGSTDADGKTQIVSRCPGEQVDLYLVWAKLVVNSGRIKA